MSSCCNFQVHFCLVLLLKQVLLAISASIQPILVDQLLLEKHDNTTADLEHTTTATDTCPPWKYKKYHNSNCTCGESIQNIVICEDDKPNVELLTCHCMSYSEKSDMTVVGNCPYLCTNDFYATIDNQIDFNDLCNSRMPLNRQGQMCGKCLENFAPSPYSYTFECIECSNYKNSWLKYILIAFLPLTIFFLVAIIVRFNAMSSSMNSFLLVSQIIGSSTAMRFIAYYNNLLIQSNLLIPFVNVLSSIYGIWNLDFFRMIYKPFCLHPNMSILQILSLDYAIAVFPLLLICVTYFLIKLHDRFEVVQLFWKPAGCIITRINRKWRTSNSLIEAFGTFFLLSCVKIINTSFDILMPVQLYNVSGKVVGLYVYYNGSMEYFGSDHLPYAMLAILMFVTFNLVPLLLLCLYPCRCFQSCLNCCRLNSQVLRTFMDAFQGCYKFEPYDCRYWAAFYLFLRIAVLGIFAATQSGYFILVTGILLVPVASLLAVVRPYRQNIYNIVDMIMILTMIQLLFSAVGFPLASLDERYDLFTSITFFPAVAFPVIYTIVQLVMCILPSRLVTATMKLWHCALCKERDELVTRSDPSLRNHVELETSENEDSPLLGNVQPL